MLKFLYRYCACHKEMQQFNGFIIIYCCAPGGEGSPSGGLYKCLRGNAIFS